MGVLIQTKYVIILLNEKFKNKDSRFNFNKLNFLGIILAGLAKRVML